MANTHLEDRSTSSLIANVIADVQTLLRDEMRLAKTEISAEIARGKNNLAIDSVALLLMTYGVVLLGVSLAYLLVELGLPWWASFGVLATLFGGGGAGLFVYVRGRRTRAHLIPHDTVRNVKETVESVRESIQWKMKPN